MRSVLGACQIQTKQKLYKPSCFNFPLDLIFSIWFFTCLFFWSHLLIKWLEAAIHSCAKKKKKSCSVKLLLTITLEKYLWAIAEQQFYRITLNVCIWMINKCHTRTVQFVTLVRRNTKHNKDESTRIERKETWKKKVREMWWVVLIFI